MYFLLDACKHPTFLRVLYFGYLFWEILAVLVPIGLIIMLMIDFTKAVVISKEDEQIKSMKLVGKRIKDIREFKHIKQFELANI